ncbi:hypothetical protein D3C71_1628340 [compost metagenome]
MAQQLCLLGADGAFDDINVAAVAVDDLAAVAARCAEADLGRFDDAHLEAVLQQEQGAGQAGVAGADDAHIGFHLTLQRRTWRHRVGRGGVVGLGVGGVSHAAGTSCFIFLTNVPMLSIIINTR